MSEWKIRYDVVRRQPGDRPTWISCCMYGDKLGFETIGEANTVLKLMKAACDELDTQQSFDVWPIAVHPDNDGMELPPELPGQDKDEDFNG